MLNEGFIKKLPDDCPTSPDIKERALCYMAVLYFGRTYYVPISKKTKKLFGIKQVKGEFYLEYDKQSLLSKFLQDTIAGIYLQIRDTIGSELHEQLSTQIQEGLQKMFDFQLMNSVEDGLNKKLLGNKKDG